jgi:hypothetical protein
VAEENERFVEERAQAAHRLLHQLSQISQWQLARACLASRELHRKEVDTRRQETSPRRERRRAAARVREAD